MADGYCPTVHSLAIKNIKIKKGEKGGKRKKKVLKHPQKGRKTYICTIVIRNFVPPIYSLRYVL